MIHEKIYITFDNLHYKMEFISNPVNVGKYIEYKLGNVSPYNKYPVYLVTKDFFQNCK